MKKNIIHVSREDAEIRKMPKDHTYGVTSNGCNGYWGTGTSKKSAIDDANLVNNSGCWVETVEEKKNTNCLEGMRCPKCKSLGSFTIGVTATVTATDEGTTDCSNIEWEDDSFCSCDECDFTGVVKDFKIL